MDFVEPTWKNVEMARSRWLFLIDLFCVRVWLHLWHLEVPRLEAQSELKLRPTPQPWHIQATSATYTAACRNTGSLTH